MNINMQRNSLCKDPTELCHRREEKSDWQFEQYNCGSYQQFDQYNCGSYQQFEQYNCGSYQIS